LNKNSNNNQSNINYYYKFPNLEELYIYYSNINIDFSSMVKLKKLGFQDISILEEVNKYSPIEFIKPMKHFSSYEDELKLIDIIFSKKTLNKIDIIFRLISDAYLKEKKNKNENIKYMDLLVNKYDFDINNFIQKFSDIKELNLTSDIMDEGEYIIFENDENIKIETIQINSNFNRKIYFSFSKIQNLYLYVDSLDVNTFSLFNNNCNYNFCSLKELIIHCGSYPIELELFNNLYNNIDKCLILEKLSIELIIPEFDKEIYLKFIEKMILKKLKFFSIFIFNEDLEEEYYSIKELKEMFPNKIYDQINYYRIHKIN
jgi:hypothetical protein